jgi:hypothetical protein
MSNRWRRRLGVAVSIGDSACGSDIAQNNNAKSGTTARSGTAAVGSYCTRVIDAGNIRQTPQSPTRWR